MKNLEGHIIPYRLARGPHVNIQTSKKVRIELSRRSLFANGKLRCGCNTSWKVTGSILDGAIGIFNDPILSTALWPWGQLNLYNK
jgi:hypothetical protein